MTKTIHGTVHGKTIELDEEVGVADGQSVEVQIKVISPSGELGWRHPAHGGCFGG